MSWASETLALVETAIKNYVTGGAVKSYTIAGKNFQREDLSKLIELRRSLQEEVAHEDSQAGSFVLAELNGQPGHRRFA